MKYLGKDGREHGSPIGAMVSNLGDKGKRQPPVIPELEPTEEHIPYTQPLEEGDPVLQPYDEDLKIAKIVINYEKGMIVSINEDGVTVNEVPIDSRLADGVCTEMMDEVLGQAELTEDEVRLLGVQTVKDNDRIISDLIAAANGKNRLISSQFDHEFIDAAAQVINDAWKAHPKTARIQGSAFFKSILQTMTSSVDKKLQPKTESVEETTPEVKG